MGASFVTLLLNRGIGAQILSKKKTVGIKLKGLEHLANKPVEPMTIDSPSASSDDEPQPPTAHYKVLILDRC